MAYRNFKYLARRTAANKVLKDKSFLILLKIQYMKDIKEDWLLWFMIFFIKKTAGSGIKSMSQNEKLAEELHKPIIRKFKSAFNIQRQYLGC